jgi:CBS domain containing-hemolysin-like protein
MTTFFNLSLVVFLVLANGFFVASEFSLVGTRRSRISTLAAAGDRKAARLLGLLTNLNAYISATQLGITLSSLGLGWVGEPAIAHLLEAPLKGRVSDTVLHTISFTIAFSIITFLHIVLGELAPKTLALERAERTALACALPLQIFYRTFAYPIRMLDWAGTRTVRLFGLHPSGDHASIYTADELRQLVDISHKSGHIHSDNRQLIEGVFDFAEAEIREALIPRTEIVALPLAASLDEVERTFIESGYSRLPVYREQFDDMVGVLFMREIIPYLKRDGSAGEFNLETLLHAPMFVPANARLGPVLAQMQAAQNHLSFVVDEHGGIEGIVTLEDLLEEIVGEINDEYDDEVRQQIEEADGSFILDGSIAVRDVNRNFDLALPEDSDYTTLAGFLLARAGRLLNKGDNIEYDGAHFTVEEVEHRRIQRIRFTPAAKDATPEEQASAARSHA